MAPLARFYISLLVLTVVTLLYIGCSPSLTTISPMNTGTVYFADNVGIWRVAPNGENKTLLSNHKFLLVSYLSLSPNQDWLAYSGSQLDASGNESNSLWVISTQGGNPQQISSAVYLTDVYWLDDSRLFFHDDQGIFIFDPRAGTRQADPTLAFHANCYTWINPAGKSLKVESCRPTEESRGYLRVINLDNTAPITITQPYQVNDEARWSADGEHVLFMDGPLDHEKLYIWTLSDRKMQQIVGQVSQTNYTFGNLSWSPDRQWVIFDEANNLCILKVASGDVNCIKGIVSAEGPGTEAAWSSNSDAILLSSNRIGQLQMGDTTMQWDLFIISIPSGKIVRVTNNSNLERRFVWGR